jgi:hypothetical protein
MVDRRGVPLAVGVTAANRPDDTVFAALVDTVAPIKRPQGRPRQRPAKLHADKGDEYPHGRQTLRQRGIQARIARKGQESTTRVGRYRWVAERTLAWLARFRRLTIRDERREDIHHALLDLGCALLCLNALHWPLMVVK